MKYIKLYETHEQIYFNGDYVKLVNKIYLISTQCRMNNCTLDTIFQVSHFDLYLNNGDISDTPYCLKILGGDTLDYLWVNEKDIKPASEEEIAALKYNI